MTPARYPLAQLPTPLVETPNLTKALGGPRILVKRDDLTGFGFGGNKVGGLEYCIAEALAQDADVVVTGAGPQSNHIRVTSAAARVAGLHVVAVMHGGRPAEAQGNLLLDELLGVEIRFTDDPDRERVDDVIRQVVDELRRAGHRPYAIPRGGGVALACLGYVDCVRELGEQLAALELQPDCLVVAVGASCTQAGLLVGARLHDAPYRIVGVTVSRPADECRERIAGFAREAARLVGHPLELGPEEITVRDGFIGRGYGVPTQEGIEAIRLVARTEGLFLDPTYTAKAMAGLIDEIRSGGIRRDEIVVFLHTGGEPGLFAHPEIARQAWAI